MMRSIKKDTEKKKDQVIFIYFIGIKKFNHFHLILQIIESRRSKSISSKKDKRKYKTSHKDKNSRSRSRSSGARHKRSYRKH